MSEHTNIQWATHTFNPWIGCTKVSPGCAHCYAEQSTPTRVARANGVELWGAGSPRQRTNLVYWKLPAKWDRDAGWINQARGLPEGERQRVFPSLCDWLDDEVPITWLMDFLRVVYATPNLDWLLLTKRPENWRARIVKTITECLENCEGRCWTSQSWLNGEPPANVWLGVSVEDQQRADERIPELLKIPARVRFLSVEPMLGRIVLEEAALAGACVTSDFRPKWGAKHGLHWVIFGGESGPNARPCEIDWIRDGVNQCRAAGVAPFVKQLGSNAERVVEQWGKGSEVAVPLTLKHPKGGDPAEWPEDLRVREFPAPTKNGKPAA